MLSAWIDGSKPDYVHQRENDDYDDEYEDEYYDDEDEDVITEAEVVEIRKVTKKTTS